MKLTYVGSLTALKNGQLKKLVPEGVSMLDSPSGKELIWKGVEKEYIITPMQE